MRVLAVTIGLALTSTAILSQATGPASSGRPDREQTFRDIGRILQRAQSAISSAQSGTSSANATAAAPAVVAPSQAAPAIITGAELTAST